ncbi:unnamed protein product, partial [Polarella glacialis]
MAPQSMAQPSKAGAVPEKRGFLRNEHSSSREYFVLRRGVLRHLQTAKGPELGTVSMLALGTQVTLLANNMLQIQCRVPHVQEYLLAATNENEAEAWHDAIKDSIKYEQTKVLGLLELLDNGCTMHKYNYSNSKRSRRYFWVSADGKELCWGRAKGGEDTQKVQLSECIGIIYGPMTTTFQRCGDLEDPAWTCFSLLFMGRTLDLAVLGELQVHAWFLGLQHLISQHGIGSMPIMSEGQFITRKVQYKLMAVAHQHGLVLGRFLISKIKEAAASRGVGESKPAPMRGLAGMMVSGGPLAKPMTHFEPLAMKAIGGKGTGGSKKDKRREGALPEVDP